MMIYTFAVIEENLAITVHTRFGGDNIDQELGHLAAEIWSETGIRFGSLHHAVALCEISESLCWMRPLDYRPFLRQAQDSLQSSDPEKSAHAGQIIPPTTLFGDRAQLKKAPFMGISASFCRS
jgi:hypothetical protein